MNGFSSPQGATNTGIAASWIRRHIEGSIETKTRLLAGSIPQIVQVASVIAASLRNGGKVLLCGNGGSAADSQHIAAEFVSVLSQDFLRPGLAAIALTTDSSILTASANDFGFEGVFKRQVQALGRKGDVLVAISTSGNSANVLCAVEEAQRLGLVTIGLTGTPGGKLAQVADIVLRVPSNNAQYIQEAHIMLGHAIVAVVERELFPAVQLHAAD